MCDGIHPTGYIRLDISITLVAVDMCVDMCIDVCVDMCVDVCVDVCV